MKNGCLVTKFYEFIVESVWNFFFILIHSQDCCDAPKCKILLSNVFCYAVLELCDICCRQHVKNGFFLWNTGTHHMMPFCHPFAKIFLFYSAICVEFTNPIPKLANQSC